ncbi:tetratricopeptide repeat protein [Streptomyces virginiae]|uniref:tetratricopeptide repeat protein n=1 Tax=Streptomyces virginiae TaxID=1961 RepID=UPI003677682E
MSSHLPPPGRGVTRRARHRPAVAVGARTSGHGDGEAQPGLRPHGSRREHRRSVRASGPARPAPGTLDRRRPHPSAGARAQGHPPGAVQPGAPAAQQTRALRCAAPAPDRVRRARGGARHRPPGHPARGARLRARAPRLGRGRSRPRPQRGHPPPQAARARPGPPRRAEVGRGDRDSARELLQDAYERGRNVLGEDHPDTIRLGHWPAVVLRETGRADRAEPLIADVHRRRRRGLGDTHLDTLRTAAAPAALAALLRESGDSKRALVLEREVARLLPLQLHRGARTDRTTAFHGSPAWNPGA